MVSGISSVNEFSTTIYKTLQGAFQKHHLDIDKAANYFIAKSEATTEERIAQIVADAGFFALISPHRINRKIVFTVAPFALPAFFQAKYFGMGELSALLKEAKFFEKKTANLPKDPIKDPWAPVNWVRAPVAPALQCGLDEILSPHVRKGYPIVEIGAGIGYTLPAHLEACAIRIQPSVAECQLLKGNRPLYQLDVEGLYQSLKGSGKKISLFFALNVFDCMAPEERDKSLSQLAALQETGDRMIFMLDHNPCVERVIDSLQALYPQHEAFPYSVFHDPCAPFTALLVPTPLAPFKSSHKEFTHVSEQYSTEEDAALYQKLRKVEKRCREINLEQFFAGQMQIALEEKGYEVSYRYHASFTLGHFPADLSALNEEIFYKPVTGDGHIRFLGDRKLLDLLPTKGLKLPERFTSAFLADIKRRGLKILGAEILVIEARKI